MWHTNAKPSCIFPRERRNSCYDKCEICFTVFSIFYLSGFAHLSFTFLPSAAFGKSLLSFLSHKTINMHATQHSLILILLCKWLNIAIFWLSFFFLLVNLDSLWNDFHTFTPHISRRPSSKPTGFFKHSFCTSSFLHTLRLSANPLFITTWSYRVFTPLIINFVKEFHHSSAAVVCWEAQSCFSTLFALFLACFSPSIGLFIFIYVFVCLRSRRLSIISLFELSALWQAAAIFVSFQMQLGFSQVCLCPPLVSAVYTRFVASPIKLIPPLSCFCVVSWLYCRHHGLTLKISLLRYRMKGHRYSSLNLVSQTLSNGNFPPVCCSWPFYTK